MARAVWGGLVLKVLGYIWLIFTLIILKIPEVTLV